MADDAQKILNDSITKKRSANFPVEDLQNFVQIEQFNEFGVKTDKPTLAT